MLPVVGEGVGGGGRALGLLGEDMHNLARKVTNIFDLNANV